MTRGDQHSNMIPKAVIGSSAGGLYVSGILMPLQESATSQAVAIKKPKDIDKKLRLHLRWCVADKSSRRVSCTLLNVMK